MRLYLYEIRTPMVDLLFVIGVDWNFHNQIIKHTELILDSRHVKRGHFKSKVKRE